MVVRVDFFLAFLLVFTVLRTAVNSDFVVARWHALQLVWRAAFLAGVPGWLQVIAKEPDVSGTDIFASSTR